MKLRRGDVVVTRFPHASGFRGKKRPALVVQADPYNSAVAHLIVAEITSNLTPTNDPAFVLIDVSTPEGKATGLGQGSLVSGLFLATVFADQVDHVIGTLSDGLMRKVDACLKVSGEPGFKRRLFGAASLGGCLSSGGGSTSIVRAPDG